MSTAPQTYWNEVYREKKEAQTSWHRAHLDESLHLIDSLDLPRDAALLDVGGGRATLVDDLLQRGFTDIGVLDISATALGQARTRLGVAGVDVNWIAGDVTEVELPAARYALWHDRAVFHFLVDAVARDRYIGQVLRAVRRDGHVVIGTFAADGPERCSGLPVARYDADALAAQFAPTFEKVAASHELHRTPWNSEQAFTYVVLRRRAEENSARQRATSEAYYT